MKKTELIAAVAKNNAIYQTTAERVVNSVFETMADALSKGEKVQIAGFGTFEVKTRAARPGRNPRTKELVQIPSSKTTTFKQSKTLKEKIQ